MAKSQVEGNLTQHKGVWLPAPDRREDHYGRVPGPLLRQEPVTGRSVEGCDRGPAPPPSSYPAATTSSSSPPPSTTRKRRGRGDSVGSKGFDEAHERGSSGWLGTLLLLPHPLDLLPHQVPGRSLHLYGVGLVRVVELQQVLHTPYVR